MIAKSDWCPFGQCVSCRYVSTCSHPEVFVVHDISVARFCGFQYDIMTSLQDNLLRLDFYTSTKEVKADSPPPRG